MPVVLVVVDVMHDLARLQAAADLPLGHQPVGLLPPASCPDRVEVLARLVLPQRSHAGSWLQILRLYQPLPLCGELVAPLERDEPMVRGAVDVRAVIEMNPHQPLALPCLANDSRRGDLCPLRLAVIREDADIGAADEVANRHHAFDRVHERVAREALVRTSATRPYVSVRVLLTDGVVVEVPMGDLRIHVRRRGRVHLRDRHQVEVDDAARPLENLHRVLLVLAPDAGMHRQRAQDLVALRSRDGPSDDDAAGRQHPMNHPHDLGVVFP